MEKKKIFFSFLTVVLVLVFQLQLVQSAVVIQFTQAPSTRSRFSTAVFSYSVLKPDGSYACMKKHHNCIIHCEVDGKLLELCPFNSTTLKNLTVNRAHHFLLNVTTPNGETNFKSYKWFIDTVPPTASITTQRNYTNAQKATITITFSESCTIHRGFKCLNSSLCDVIVTGPGEIDASTFQIIKPNIEYSLIVNLSSKIVYGHVVIKMVDNFCKDVAGNQFKSTDDSVTSVTIDRRPVTVDLWTTVPSYEMKINKVPRTVFATNTTEDMEICLDFSDPVVNSTKEIISALHTNVGNFIAVHSKTHGNRRFIFKLTGVHTVKIVIVKLESGSIIGRSGTSVSDVSPVVFMYDSTNPNVKLRTSSPGVTKEPNIDVMVEFTKPVFGFQTSGVKVGGGRITRFKEVSKSLYSVTVLGTSHDVISVLVPEGKVSDIAKNQNLASKTLKVRQYSTPAMSVALHSFVTAGLLATSFAAAILSVSSSNLGAIGALASGTTDLMVSDPSMNLLGMVGHLQVFVLSDWISVSLPIEYSETIKGLRWLIPHEKLPWGKEKTSKSDPPEHHDKLLLRHRNFPKRLHYDKEVNYTVDSLSNNTLYLYPQTIPSQIEQLNTSMTSISIGQPLESNEYSIYFLREEPLLALIKTKTYDGWNDFEMNLFWLGVVGGGLFIIHLLIVQLLRWRIGSSVHGRLSVPRFELFLIIIMIPCISQSSAYIIRGGSTRGVIAGTLLLAILGALILSVCMFLVIAIFVGGRVQYKEIKQLSMHDPWPVKLLDFFLGKATKGKWFYQDLSPSSFFLRCGFLFEDRKGPSLFVFVDKNDPNRMPKWTDSEHRGIGRMRAVPFDDGNEGDQISITEKLLGCARSLYLIIDLLRRVSLGIISGGFTLRRQSQSVIAFALTLGQLIYLCALKPYIRRGVHVVESVSLLCEAAIFGISIFTVHTNPFEEHTMGIIMSSILLTTFLSQLVNEWYALVSFLLRLPQSNNPSFKLGVRFVVMGLILPFLPRKHRLKLAGSSQPSTGLVPVLPLSPERQTSLHTGPVGSMTATVVPLLSPQPHGLREIGESSHAQEAWEQKGTVWESRSELRKLRDLAKASFSVD
ncbi:hypothetical protein ACHQM5_010557 [Ranunculus cassubicifolius]